MVYLLACVISVLSFTINKILGKYIGNVTIISFSPLVEEFAKTLPAYLLTIDIQATHIAFGFIEAGYDWYTSQGNITAAMLSILGHGMFGFFTVGVLFFTGSIWLAIASGLAVHLAWNVVMIRLNSGG